MVATHIMHACYSLVTPPEVVDKGHQENTRTTQSRAAQTLLGGLTWTVLTCSAGVIGYAVGGDFGAFTGALCAIVTGVLCIDVIQWGYR